MLNRREFMWGTGGGVVLLGAGATALGNSLWKKPSVPVLVDRTESRENSICQLCPSACGVSLRICNGSPVTVTGNPLHPVNRGGLCARGGALLQAYYDPDRFAGPSKKDGGLIGGRAPLEWEAALAEVAGKVQAAAKAGKNRVALIDGGARNIGGQLLRRLVRSTGSNLIARTESAGWAMTQRAVAEMQGMHVQPLYDLARSDFLISFDSGLLEASSDAMNLHRSLAEMRGNGARFVHAGPRMGVTGSKADTWLPIAPSSAGVLALGLAHVIIKERLARDGFLADHATRYDAYEDEQGNTRMGIRGWILKEFSPQRVGELTGLEWEQIITTARQFGSARRPLAIGPMGTASGFSMFDVMAIHTLNTVVGAIDVPGGVLFAREAPVAHLEALSDAAGATQTVAVDELAARIVEGRENVDVLFVNETDPVFAAANPEMMRQALEKVPFVVSTSPFANDTAAMAHVVLPDLLWIERPCDAVGVTAEGHPVVSMSPAAVKPRTEGRAVADVALALAQRVDVAKAHFSWKSYDEVAAQQVAALFGSGAGVLFADVHRSTWARLLERGGWRLAAYRSPEQLATKIDAVGGWWEPAYYHGESRRIFGRSGHKLDLEPVRTAAGTAALMPRPDVGEGQLELIVYPELALDTPLTGSMPYLMDTGSPISERGWWPVAELNPKTAAARGIRHGARIVITGDAGSIEAVTCLTPTIRPDVVAVSAGTGRTHGGRYVSGIGANPYGLVKFAGTRAKSDEAVIPSTAVQIRKV